MNASELLRHQIDDIGFQLSQCYAGWSQDRLDEALIEGGLSGRATLEHLTECYVAASQEAAGNKHAWGTYKFPDPAWEPALAEWKSRRDAAAVLVCADDEACLKRGHAYIVGHDAYHVGQLCQLRMKLDPEWNANAIYG